ncbi:IS3 family transposase, partial [Desulfobotulus sp. H1]|nr:IS3 family transposase [Desulfobotulus pelophilus]
MRWKKNAGGEDQRCGPAKSPKNKLTEFEKQAVIDTANSLEFRDLPPKQIVPILADQGIYIASESSFYRILKEQNMLRHRESSKPAERKKTVEYAATGPWQLWSWDMTYMKTDIKGQFFYLYMIIDVWSRKIIAARVHENEC